MENNASNVKVLTETGRATKALVTAGENLSKVVLSISAFTQEVNELVEQIDLNFKIQENAEAELNNLLDSKGLVAVSADTISKLENEIETLVDSRDDAIKSEVAKAVNAVKSETSNQIKIKDLEHTNATAKVNAELDSANSKIKYLEDALETANKALDAERAARIEIASKTAQPTINVNGKM